MILFLNILWNWASFHFNSNFYYQKIKFSASRNCQMEEKLYYHNDRASSFTSTVSL